MAGSDIDLDALLDAHSSDEDDADLPELDRSIDDILLDADEEEEGDVERNSDISAAIPEKKLESGIESQGSQAGLVSTGVSKTAPRLWDISGTIPFYQVTTKPSPKPGAALAAATAASRHSGTTTRTASLRDVPSETPDESGSLNEEKEEVEEKEEEEQKGLDWVSSSIEFVSNEDTSAAKRDQVEMEATPVSLSTEDTVSSSLEGGEVLDERIEVAVNTVDLTEDNESDLVAVQILDEKLERGEDGSSSTESSEESVLEEAFDEHTSPEVEEVKSLMVEAEEREKRAANSGLHLEEGAAAQPMQLEGIQRGPPAIGLLQLDWGGPLSFALSSIAMMRDHGNPRCLAVQANFIAVGMSKGTVLLALSKYSATTTADNNEAKVVLLSNAADKSHASASVMCFSFLGDLLLVGYTNGSVILWDVPKAAVAKAVTGEHHNVIVHAAFVGQDGSTGRPLKAMTADCKGVVMLHTFTLVPLLRRFSVTTQCLLDGQRTGVVLSLAPLLLTESLLQNITGSGITGAAGNDAGRKFLYDGSSSSDETGGLVVFVTQQIALVFRLLPALEICAKLTRPEGVREGSIPYASWRGVSSMKSESTAQGQDEPLLALAWGKKVLVLQLQKADLKVLAEWDIDNKAAGVAWLGDQMLVVATVKAELCLFTKEGLALERAAIRDNDGHTEPLTFHTYFLETCNNPEKVYGNSLGVRGAASYFLGASKLWRARLLPWQDRIKALQDAGDWMGAFQIAMELFDGRARGVTGLPSGLRAMQEAIMPNLLALLSSYIDEAFAYVRLALGVPETEAAREQYARVGRVAIEFCVHISRTDVLFENVFRKFDEVAQAATFLELLEPYILKDMLCGLAPEIMQSLVEHYSSKGWLQRVEQCILHMDIASLDFNQVMRLCREHGLFSALIYLYNKGLNDFKSPLEELLIAAQDQHQENASSFGYKLLVYLKYCFSGLAFPPGRGSLPAEQVYGLKIQLLEYLLDPAGSGRDAESVYAVYPRLHYLLNLDVSATLDVFKVALGNVKEAEGHLVQLTIDPLVHIVETVLCMDTEFIDKTSYILQFIADYVSAGAASIPPTTLDRILNLFLDNTQESILPDREELTVKVLEAVPAEDWDPDAVLELAKKTQFWRVSALVYTRKGDHISALYSHLEDVSRPRHTFNFVISKLDRENGLKGTALTEFRAAVISRIHHLVQKNRIAAFYIVLEYFNDQLDDVVKALQPFPLSLFNFLKALMEVRAISDTISDVQVSEVDCDPWDDRSRLATLLENMRLEVTDDMVEEYIELMCELEPSGVLNFLQGHENYRLEQCLKLCQKYGVKDGAAFLLEQAGDVGSALTLILGDLSKLFHELDAAVAIMCTASSTGTNIPEEQALHSVKNAAVSLCQRNTFRLDPQEAESLWFHLLDRFIHPLDALNSSKHNKAVKPADTGSSSRYEWQVFQVIGAASVLRKMLSKFAGDIVTGMIGHVPVQVILNKIVSDHGNHELGDFKNTILEMLSAYGYELAILGTARRILETDMFHDIQTLKRGRSRGLSPLTASCSVCSHTFVEDQSARKGVQIFSCGHLVHLSCMEDANSKSNRCPVCMRHDVGTDTNYNNGYNNGSFPQDRKGKGHEQAIEERQPIRKQGVSRFELLKSLQKGEPLPELNPDLPRLQLSPPIKYKHRPSRPLSGYSNTNISGNSSRRPLQQKSHSLRVLKAK
ncbi:vacuolar protein sorting-associated protein 8 homolog [Selaginella moellendorffii]|uniref:vacuolar protein sorting-associated protein 8 homolog n=1 Tax=Selaginella moellendorffii TaxID=88036 RepID=UPI000D1D0C6E|nr:vacuolar protein sorting-associated protein 8 homolog [Selaginella moellendorffii]XP_024531345.1 vacuolar protein sorting-associated protein 8 homolog [Selaginella moellendorffii]XP_024531346.1 vacuolar protein sorting-associated protein 8 homolog [Selaginella moellendorffii]XP_024531348.1 vacuolar protein sorting-associated protein 8 homolog [Selaginella moellendorffii]XP_024531349.1 vacuolar protein sorting-associated protein 8 homolog [Selaginella moellendorffii]XP_024531350.1 vacuolar p|eukprot:XP_024531344.1 vacuolar protein sorting-associated protein 8 homolog [Selaginella moellendorffii]